MQGFFFFFSTLRSININVFPSIQVWLDNTYSPGESGANNAEPTDVKSPLWRRPRKQASPLTARQQSVFHLFQGPGVASGAGWRQTGSPLALTWDFFSPTRVGSNMMTQLSAQHRHFNDLKARLPPLSARNVEKSLPGPLKSGPTSSSYTPDIVHAAPDAAKPVWRPNSPIF